MIRQCINQNFKTGNCQKTVVERKLCAKMPTNGDRAQDVVNKGEKHWPVKGVCQ